MSPEELERLLEALAAQESRGSGDTAARNPRTGAYGRYQILPSNWGPWSRELFGEEVEPTPENQEQVVRHKMGQYLERFGPEGALVAWYGGPGRAREWVRNPDNPWFDRRHGGGQEPSVREYVSSVMGRVQSEAEPMSVVIGRGAPEGERAALEAIRSRPMAAASTRVAQPQQSSERISQLATALRNADAAGDTAAAQRFATEIVRLRGSESASSAGAPDPGTAEPLSRPRQLAREAVEGMGPVASRVNAMGSGVGSALFGIGTPLVAAEAMLASRLRGDVEPFSWEDALEYSRERRAALSEERPGSNIAGMGLGIAGSMVGGASAAGRLPATVRAIATPTRAAEGATRAARVGNAAANAARASVAGAGAAGTTAAMEEGLDAAPGAAGAGALLAPLAAPAVTGLVRGGGVVKDYAMGQGPLRMIASRMRAPVEVVEENLSRWREAFPNRAPRVAEVLDPRSAEEMALIGQGGVGTRAGRVFRETAEQAEDTRPFELAETIQRGGSTTTPSAEANRLAPIQREAAEETGRRVQTSEAAVAGRATARYRDVMESIGSHEVPVDEDMLKALSESDIQTAIPTILRRRLNEQLASGAEAGSITLPMDMWDMLRKELGKRAGQPGASQLFGELRENVTSYVSDRVPEYRRLLEEYGRRSEVAAGVTAGRGALTQDTREFVDMLRTAGGGAPDRPIRPREAAMTRVGARIGARTNFSNLLSRDPAGTMERLANEPGLRANLRAVLQPEEWRRLEELADRYGHQLRRVEGAQAGAQGVRAAEATTDFADDARRIQATPEGASSLAGAGRGRLVDAVRESPQAASAVAEGLQRHPGLQDRIATALGPSEAARLTRAGQAATLARRNLGSMTPAGTEASQRAQAMAQEVNTIIGALVVTWGRSSGAMQASVGTRLMQWFSMTQKSAERAAQLLTDPEQAPAVIAYLRARGASAQKIRDLYLQSAAAAGILAGANTDGGG